jgi:hypothetical protein
MGSAAAHVQELPMRIALLFALVLCTVFESLSAASEPNAVRAKIPHATIIQGYPCARGNVWFYPDGSLNQCAISRATSFGEAQIPRRSVIELWPNGATRYLTLSHNTILSGYRALGGSALLRIGSFQPSINAFYPSGKLRTLYLVDDQIIQGIPCRGGATSLSYTSLQGGNQVDFYEDGQLRSCKLTHDYAGQRSGQRLLLPYQPKPPAATRLISDR